MPSVVTALPSDPRLNLVAESNLPTEFGDFRLLVFHWEDDAAHPELSRQHLALVRGDVKDKDDVPVRIHSECLTGEVFGSLKCDCRGQLIAAQEWIAANNAGVILYLRQEGRGIGLANKIKAYALQEQGADTIEANVKLHLPVDARQYDVAAAILRFLHVSSVKLLTNNPEKVRRIQELGVIVKERIPTVVRANRFSVDYLRVKQSRLQHEIPSEALTFDEPSKVNK
jgi:GTP cyclohydrolase II